MPYFMGDHISLGKLGLGAAEPSLQLVKKSGIEKYGPIRRAIEWPDCRGRDTAAGFHLIVKKYHVRLLVGPADLAKLLVPHVLGEAEDGGYELAAALFLRCQFAFFDLIIARALRREGAVADKLIQLLRIDTQQSAKQQDNQCAQTAANGETLFPKRTAILYVFALLLSFPFHDQPLN